MTQPLRGRIWFTIPPSLPNILREDTGSVRLDYNVSEKDRIFFRYNINDSLTNYTYGLNQGQVSPQKLRTQLAKIDETHTFTSTLAERIQRGHQSLLFRHEFEYSHAAGWV